MPTRRRFKQQLTLEDRLSAWAEKIRDQAEKLPPGPERTALLKRAGQAELATSFNDGIKPQQTTK